MIAAAALAASPARSVDSGEAVLARMRVAQRSWAEYPVRQRLGIFRAFRHLLASEGAELAGRVSPSLPRSEADTLSAEIIPLAEAVRFLEQHAAQLLQRVTVSKRSRPLWLSGLELQVQRDPFGVVLVIAPANYPLFLPGVQALQALAAGNAVVWKPGRGGLGVAEAMRDLLVRAGLPADLLTITDESPQCGQELIRLGVDKVVMTGSAPSGRAVLDLCAQTLTPVTVELSGCDAMFVLADADLGRAAAALAFGLRLNGSGTCIAPRRVFIHRSRYDSFRAHLRSALASMAPVPLDGQTAALVIVLVQDACEKGATILAVEHPTDGQQQPVILENARPGMRVMQTDVFAPIAALCAFDEEKQALALSRECPYALGATVFGSAKRATAFARQVSGGIVVVNDMVAPTADPRLSFGGRGQSGFGKTRGPEGLLEMTVSKTIAIQKAGRLRHLEPAHPKARSIFVGFLAISHSRGWRHRLRAFRTMTQSLRHKSESQNS